MDTEQDRVSRAHKKAEQKRKYDLIKGIGDRIEAGDDVPFKERNYYNMQIKLLRKNKNGKSSKKTGKEDPGNTDAMWI